MRKKNIGFIISTFLCAIILCVFIGRATTKSFVNNVELEDYLLNVDLKVVYFNKGYDKETSRDFIDFNKVEQVSELKQKDTVVVKAKLKEDFKRKIYYECILSELQVVTLYEGNLKEGDIISVFEPVNCVLKNQMLCTDGYSMMEEDKEYILFLKPFKNVYYGEEDYVYVPTTTMFSKYEVNDKIPQLYSRVELEEPEYLHTYQEMKNDEIYLYDYQNLLNYNNLKSQVLSLYN